jgi:cadmium resistance protein CadD (predicted permease)
VDWLRTTIAAIVAFTVTNLDDLGLLMLWFGAASSLVQVRRIVLGQYLGFGLLVLASLLSWIGGQWLRSEWLRSEWLRPEWLGWLGLIPIAIGLQAGFEWDRSRNSVEPDVAADLLILKGPGWQQVAQVMGVTIANGSDNVGVYIPFFMTQSIGQLGLTLTVFFLLVALWCGLALWLVRRPLIEVMIRRYGDRMMPIGLIALGLYIWVSGRSWLVLWGGG